MIGCGISFDRAFRESAAFDTLSYSWTRIQNVLIIDLEFAKSPVMMLPCWDIQTCKWINEHFKDRIDNELKDYLGPFKNLNKHLLGYLFVSLLFSFDLMHFLYALQLHAFIELSKELYRRRESFFWLF